MNVGDVIDDYFIIKEIPGGGMQGKHDMLRAMLELSDMVNWRK